MKKKKQFKNNVLHTPFWKYPLFELLEIRQRVQKSLRRKLESHAVGKHNFENHYKRIFSFGKFVEPSTDSIVKFSMLCASNFGLPAFGRVEHSSFHCTFQLLLQYIISSYFGSSETCWSQFKESQLLPSLYLLP